MKRLIENLQSKSYETRRTILISATVACSLIVVFIWIILLRANHEPLVATSAPAPQSEKQNLKEFGAQISSAWGDIREEWSGLTDQFKSASSTTSTLQ